ncbi:TPA: hypothetical protein ACGR6T_004746 [Klebsiella aerogenes]
MTDKKDVLGFLAGKPKKNNSNNRNEMSIEDAIDINKDKFFEVERQQDNKPSILFSEKEDSKASFKVLGTIDDSSSKRRLLRIPDAIDAELLEFCGKQTLGKEYVALAYYAMKILKSENKSIVAIFND